MNGCFVAGDLEIDGGHITRYGLKPAGKHLALPGLVDLQVNGYAGTDFLNATEQEYDIALSALRRDGVFAIQPTLITAPEGDVGAALRTAHAVQTNASTPCDVLGVHLEGPFLSPNHRGIHRHEHLSPPDVETLDRLCSYGPVSTITIAPELPGALPLIAAAVSRGLLVQLGHSGATAGQAHEAFNAGARSVTHIFNGMRPFAHRDPGIAGAALARPDVTIQVIADEHHVAPDAVRMVLRTAQGQAVLVTDAISAARAPAGRYTVGGHDVWLEQAIPRLSDGTLAGSTAPLMQQVRNVVGYGWPIESAVNMASRNPARLHGRLDLGSLHVGGRANLVIVDEGLEIVRVLADGTDIPLSA